LELGLAVLLDGLVVVVGGISKRIKLWDRVKGSWKSVTMHRIKRERENTTR
jgi:hypothetical protein